MPPDYLLPPQGTYLPERQYQMFFFHLLVNLETDYSAWKWNFYRAKKTFLEFPGIFASTDPFDLDEEVNTGSLEVCAKEASCVGVELPANRLLSYLDLDTRVSLKIKNVSFKTGPFITHCLNVGGVQNKSKKIVGLTTPQSKEQRPVFVTNILHIW